MDKTKRNIALDKMNSSGIMQDAYFRSHYVQMDDEERGVSKHVISQLSGDDSEITCVAYENMALKTASDATLVAREDVPVAWLVGLTGEVGEVAELLKRKVYRKKEVADEDILSELGDVLWYLTALSDSLGFSLFDVMLYNIAKLNERHRDA